MVGSNPILDSRINAANSKITGSSPVRAANNFGFDVHAIGSVKLILLHGAVV